MKLPDHIAGMVLVGVSVAANAGPYSPAPGQPGSNAVAADDARIVAWASAVGELRRGSVDISDAESPPASFGSGSSALGPANAYDATTGFPSTTPGSVISLGDRGSITLLFPKPVTDDTGPDFAVFENAFNDTFLELAFVSVTSDGVHWARFPARSLTQTRNQIRQDNTEYSGVDPTEVDGLAGKFRAGWGVPFDLNILADDPKLDVKRITGVRLTDVVGSINPLYGSLDDSDLPRLINEPWPTPFSSGGFDLDAVAVLHQLPEPAGAGLLVWGAFCCCARQRR